MHASPGTTRRILWCSPSEFTQSAVQRATDHQNLHREWKMCFSDELSVCDLLPACPSLATAPCPQSRCLAFSPAVRT
jgi:hypothetical protein